MESMLEICKRDPPAILFFVFCWSLTAFFVFEVARTIWYGLTGSVIEYPSPCLVFEMACILVWFDCVLSRSEKSENFL